MPPTQIAKELPPQMVAETSYQWITILKNTIGQTLDMKAGS